MSACCLPKHTNVYFPTFLLSYFLTSHVQSYIPTRLYVQALTSIRTSSHVHTYHRVPPVGHTLHSPSKLEGVALGRGRVSYFWWPLGRGRVSHFCCKMTCG